MTTINIYKYQGEGGMIISPVLLPMDYVQMARLIAQPGKVVTNGDLEGTVLDVEIADVSSYYEIDEPERGDL